MNYGKGKASQRQKNISSKKNMKKKRVGVRFFKAVVICILLAIILGIAGCGIFIKRIIDDTPEVSPANVKPSGYTTFVYGDNGQELERFVSSGSNRIYKTIDEIPENLSNAFVAIEDSRFYQHNGIDLQGILRAGVVGIAHGGDFSEGASTLTQQLIKNNVFPEFTEEKTFYDRLERKLQEQFLAVDIEKQMTKQEIIEAYMNTINLGQNCLGVQAASQRYFGKDVTDLTLSECAVIAGITQNPTRYDPVVNPDQNAIRRQKVLDDMLDQGYIDQAAHDEALADNVYERIQTSAATTVDDSPYSYFIDELSAQVIQDLRDKKGYSYTQAYNALYSGGLTITATQSPYIQSVCDAEVADDSNYPSNIQYGIEWVATVTRADGVTVDNYSTEMLRQYLTSSRGMEYMLFDSTDEAQQAVDEYKGTLNIVEGDTVDERLSFTPQPQTSVVVMDQYTGEVKAIVGGRGSKDSSLSYNRATEATRQPGSCFKILAAYAPALDTGGYTLATSIVDEKYTTTSGHEIKNWWGNYYLGSVTVRKAIEQSMNVCAVKTLTDIGLQTGYDYLTNFGFSTLVDGTNPDYPGYSDIQQVTAIGGITRGVYNMEMTAAYATIANNGVYTKPILYTQILDHDGNVLIDNTPDTHKVLEESTAALLTNAMQDVINQGTGTTARLDNMPASGKTGTTDDGEGGSVDIWLSAYTPYYTCSVWGGYDCNMPLTSTTWHESLWKNIMDRIHSDLPYTDFEIPSSIKQLTVCTQTGLLATSGCPSVTDYFATATAPTQSCTQHSNYSNNYNSNYSDNSSDSDTSDNSSSNNSNTNGSNSNNNGNSDTTNSDNNNSTDNSGGSNGNTDNTGGGTDTSGGGGTTVTPE